MTFQKGYKPSDETRRKMSERQIGEKNHNFGKPISLEVKKKISMALKGRIKSKEECRKISESKKGHTVSEEARKKISQGNKGKQTWLGRKHSLESRLKMSIANKGRKLSKETKQKMRGRTREKSHAWKGGKWKRSGYIYTYNPNHPFSTKAGYIRESRLVVEQQIGRYLTKEEVVHHLGEKTDPSPNLLMAFINQSAHMRFHKNPDNVKSEEIIFDGRLLNPNPLLIY